MEDYRGSTHLSKRWQKEELRVLPGTDLQVGVWYRSALWDADHTMGRKPEYQDEGDELSWCGRALGYVVGWEEEFALYRSVRGGGKCAYCKQAEDGWKEAAQ